MSALYAFLPALRFVCSIISILSFIFVIVKKQNWIPGLIVSLGVSLIAALPRVIRMEKFEFHPIIISVGYNFTFCIFCWLAHQFILSKSKQFNIWLMLFFINFHLIKDLFEILAFSNIIGIPFFLHKRSDLARFQTQ